MISHETSMQIWEQKFGLKVTCSWGRMTKTSSRLPALNPFKKWRNRVKVNAVPKILFSTRSFFFLKKLALFHQKFESKFCRKKMTNLLRTTWFGCDFDTEFYPMSCICLWDNICIRVGFNFFSHTNNWGKKNFKKNCSLQYSNLIP